LAIHNGGSRSVLQATLFLDALDQAVADEIRAATHGGFVLGAARFHWEIAAMLGLR
jgi:hypothetical protein